jgi:hypothetical protein
LLKKKLLAQAQPVLALLLLSSPHEIQSVASVLASSMTLTSATSSANIITVLLQKFFPHFQQKIVARWVFRVEVGG